MKLKGTILILFLIGLVQLSHVSAATINAISSGNWTNTSIWSGGIVPGEEDDVIIDGFSVTINSTTTINDITVKSMVLSNANSLLTADSKLLIEDGKTLTTLGDLTLISTTSSKKLCVIVKNDETRLQVNGNINMTATGAGQIEIELRYDANLGLKGNFVRTGNFGSLLMQNDCFLILDGTVSQTIPVLDLDPADNDEFQITNLIVENSNDITLLEPLIINETLTLNNGKIITTDANPIIIEDNASIVGASSNSYVVGPVVKKGRSNNLPFTFPTGSATQYAPLTVSKITDANAEYKAVYKSDPPPYGTNYGTNVIGVDPTQYWELNRVAGSNRLSYTLSWSDGAASQLTSLSNTIVVKANQTTNAWENMGQTSASGGIGSGQGGTVQSLESDPPPYGVSKLSIGRGNPTGPLPVELINFQSKKNEGKVYLLWKTASEINSSHYDVERSVDGVNFQWISTVKIEGNSQSIRDYRYIDYTPNTGVNYYRLKIMDLDGSYEYSDLTSVVFSSDGSTILISPNPVYEFLIIETKEEIGDGVMLEIYDRSGVLIYKSELDLEDGKAKLNTSDLQIHTPGAYFLRLSGNTSSKMLKFMKL
jgi:hypothetical protein